MPIEPISPCCSAGAGQLGEVNTQYDCGPGGDCPKYSLWDVNDPDKLEDTFCMYKESPYTIPQMKCQCVSAGALNGRLADGWMFKYVLARLDPTLPYLVSRTVALKLKSSGWYPTDLSPVELSVLLRTVPTKRGTDYNLGKPTLPTPLPPMIPPKFPGQSGNNCFMVYHVDPDTGEYPPLDFTCMIYNYPKPWNPKDPCLLRLLAEYREKLKDIADEYKKNRRDLNMWAQKMLQTIQEQQLVCDRLCAEGWADPWPNPQWDGQVDACLNDCEQTAVQDRNAINQEYARQSEYLQSAEFKARENAANVFFDFAVRQCGYSRRSIPVPLWPRWGYDPQDWFPPYWDDTYSPPDTVDTWDNPIY